jgi:hypothetical protein
MSEGLLRMYEHKSRPLLPRIKFLYRVLHHSLLAVLVILGALGIGVLGYHFIDGLAWIDATLNASMILGGMGPVDIPMKTTGGKIFASAYALFSGLIFIGVTGLLLAPFTHRLIHRFHLESGRE